MVSVFKANAPIICILYISIHPTPNFSPRSDGHHRRRSIQRNIAIFILVSLHVCHNFGWCILVNSTILLIYINSAPAKQQHHLQKYKWKCGEVNCVAARELWYYSVVVHWLPTYALREKRNVDTILIINWTSTNTQTHTHAHTRANK